jgi:putative transposase
MARKRNSPEQIVAKLREADAIQAAGGTASDAARKLGVSENTLYRWRARHGSMTVPDVRRLKELERQNAQLKKLVAEQALDIAMLKEVAKGNF